MSRAPLILLGLLAAAAAGAVAGRLAAPPAPEIPPDDARIAGLESRIDEIEARLRDRPGTAEPPPPAATVPAPTNPEALVPVRVAPGAESAATTVPEEKIDEKVREAMAKEQQERTEAIGRRFAVIAAQRESDMLDRLTEKLGLSANQRGDLERILAKRREAVGGFFRAMFGSTGSTEEPPDMEKLRDEVAKARREADEAVKALLGPDQYEVFRQEEENLPRGPGMFGGRGGRGR